MKIPITRPVLGEDEVNAVKEVILSGWVTQGPRVETFEEMFASKVGARYACAVSNCTTALHLGLMTVGVRPGDTVITVSHSFIATANAIRHCGAEPVFVDIDPETYNMDSRELFRVLEEDCLIKNGDLYYRYLDRITTDESFLGHVNRSSLADDRKGRVAAILPVHQMGMPCDIAEIVRIAAQYHIPVVEDAACAIGSELSCNHGQTWETIGKPHGDIACFSFHPRKVLTTGDGGMITTDNFDFQRTFKLLRQHGMSMPDTVRHDSKKVLFEQYLATGFNYRLTDIQAAVGAEQLKKLRSIVDERRRLASVYEDLLSNNCFIKIPKTQPFVRPNWQSYPVKLSEKTDCSQIQVMQELLDAGISTRRGIMNAHQEPPYASANWYLPKSELCRDRTILLPLFPGMTDNELEYVSVTLRGILSK